ncbi:hypothetical protein ACJJTC_016453 [Scirpophaga incertulas]
MEDQRIHVVQLKLLYEFNKRNQTSGETVEEYIRSLYVAAVRCNFSVDVRDEMIRDRIVVGILSPKAREKMLLMCNLTLEDAKTISKNVEMYEKQGRFEGFPFTRN